jgi:hypothetical protein
LISPHPPPKGRGFFAVGCAPSLKRHQGASGVCTFHEKRALPLCAPTTLARVHICLFPKTPTHLNTNNLPPSPPYSKSASRKGGAFLTVGCGLILTAPTTADRVHICLIPCNPNRLTQSRGFKEKRGFNWSRDCEISRRLKPPGFIKLALQTLINIKSRGVDLPRPSLKVGRKSQTGRLNGYPFND